MRLKTLDHNIKIRMITLFLISMSTNTIFPFMAIYSTRALGALNTSLLLSLGIILNFLSSIISGSLSDKFGRKKIMIIAESLRLITFVIMALSNSPWFESVLITIIFFVFNNICNGLYTPAAEAMLLDSSKIEERPFIYSLLYWISNVSVAIGGTIGAIFFEKYTFYLLIFLVFSSGVSLVLTIFFMKECKDFENISEKKLSFQDFINIKSYKLALKNKIFLLFLIVTILIVSIESHLTNFIAIRLENEMGSNLLDNTLFNMNGIQIMGFLRTENTICVIILSLVFTYFLKNVNKRKAILVGFIMYTFGYFYVSYSMNFWVLIISMFIAVVGEVIAMPLQQSYLGDIIPDDSRGTYLALNKIASKLGLLIGTLGIYCYSLTSVIFMSVSILISGLVATIMMSIILSKLYKKKSERMILLCEK